MVSLITINSDITAIMKDSLELVKWKKPSDTPEYEYYSNWSINLFKLPSEYELFKKSFLYIYSEYESDIIIYVWTSHKISTEIHEKDVVLPNVLFDLNKDIADIDINSENKDDFLKDPIFLENYSLQNDYDLEHFWLRVGWISVSWNINVLDSDIEEKLRIAYEADVYDNFAYNFAFEAKNMNILDKSYIILWVDSKNEKITLDHLSHIINFIIWNTVWFWEIQDDL